MKWKINNMELDESDLIGLIKQNLKDLLLNLDISSSKIDENDSQESKISEGEICVDYKRTISPFRVHR